MADNGATRSRIEGAPWETDPAWHPARREGFVLYRDMPDRSIRAVARALGKSSTLIGRWSSEHNWPERVAAWEAECDRRIREEFLDATVGVARAQAEDAAELRAALMAPARALRARIDRARAEGVGEPFQELATADLLRLTATAGRAFAQVAQVERLAHGLSTENRAGYDGGPPIPADVARKSMGELRAYLTGCENAARW